MKSDVREMNIFDKPIIDTDRLIEKMSEKQQKRKYIKYNKFTGFFKKNSSC